MREIYRKLAGLGVLQAYVMRGGRVVRSPFLGCRTKSLLVRQTPEGREFLAWPRRVI
jgi:hypothetical protein